MERFLELVEGSMKEKSEITLQLLNEALDRLLSGSPVNTKLDGKISIKRINDEAKLSRGAIYYYKDFVELAKEKIQEHKNDVKVEKSPATKEEKLRNQKKKKKRLKKDYYEQVSTLNGLNDAMVAENAVLAYRCMVLEDEINALTNGKISLIK